MTGRLLAQTLPLVLPLVAMAQRPLPPSTQVAPSVKCRFENAADSLAYLHFTAGLRERPPELPMDTSTAGLRMAWRASEFGHTWYVKRGDGSPLQSLDIRPFHLQLPVLAAEGKRVLQVVEEYPCALTCHTVWYFVVE
jgi:hypothetical protein